MDKLKFILQRLPSCEAGFNVVPPLHSVAFAQFPAKQDHPAIPQRGKVNEATRVVFKLDAEAFQLAHSEGKLDENSGVL